MPNHTDASVLFATHSTLGVLDLGATKTVIGSAYVKELVAGLQSIPNMKLSRRTCDITFKFGNQGTLHSSEALVIPIGKLLYSR